MTGLYININILFLDKSLTLLKTHEYGLTVSLDFVQVLCYTLNVISYFCFSIAANFVKSGFKLI